MEELDFKLLPDPTKVCADHRYLMEHIKEQDEHIRTTDAQLQTLTENVVVLKQIEMQNKEHLEKIDERIAAIEAVPTNRWNNAVNYILTCCIGFAMGAVMNGTFL